MEELVYNVLLKSAGGPTLPGMLRFRFTELGEVTGVADTASLLADARERQFIELDVLGVQGALSVPLLTGQAPLPLQGVAYASQPSSLPLTAMLGGDYDLGLGMQFNFIDPTRVTGGLTWRYGTPHQVIYSLLGTRHGFGL